MSAKIFDAYDEWQTEVFTCPKCGWKGTFEEGYVEHYRELMDSSCPECDYYSTPMLAIVNYPRFSDMEKNWDKLSEREKKYVRDRRVFLEKVEKMSLKSASELPDLFGQENTIYWDFIETDDEKYTVLISDGVEIWRELALYGGYQRFKRVAEILQEKYGSSLADLIPTPGSWDYLIGDDYSSELIKGIRVKIQDLHGNRSDNNVRK
jgi:hypothetical protein